MLVTSSRDTRASSRVPTSMYSFSPTSCCSTISAPTRRLARCVDRLHDLLDRLVLRHPVARRVERPGADLRQHAPDVVLEDDEEQDERPAEDVVQQDVDACRSRTAPTGSRAPYTIDEADQHRHGARAADQVDAGVDADREQEDVDAVLPAEAVGRGPSCARHRRRDRQHVAHRGDVVHAQEAGAACHGQRHRGGRPVGSPLDGPRRRAARR